MAIFSRFELPKFLQLFPSQASLPEGYHMTPYKILLRLLWTVRHCRHYTKYLVKIDDSSVVDLARLIKTLDEVQVEGSIVCPSVMRGVRIWRHPEAPLHGKWTVNESIWPAPSFMDHCHGWLWVTTPRVAADLASVATILPKAVPMEGSLLEDTLITGYQRSHLPGVQVTSDIQTGTRRLRSTCSFLG